MRYKICFNEAATKSLLEFLPSNASHTEFIQTRLVEWTNAVMKESGIADLKEAPSMVEDAVGTVKHRTAEIDLLLYEDAEKILQNYTMNEILLNRVPANPMAGRSGYFVLSDSASHLAGFFEDAVKYDAPAPDSVLSQFAVEVYHAQTFDWE